MMKANLRYRASATLLTVLLCVVLCGTSIAESTASIWLVKPTNANGWVNLRTEPSLDSEGLARASLDQEVIVIDVDGEWARVIFNGQVGFMKTEFLEETNTIATYSEATVPSSTTFKEYEMKLYTEAPNTKSSVRIEYPFFSGKDSLNAMIQQKIQEILKYPSSYYPQFGFTAEYRAAVTLNNSKMISIVFWGDVLIEKGRPGTVLWSLNVDLSTMKKITLADLYVINTDFEAAFFSNAYFPSKPATSHNDHSFSEILTLQMPENNPDGAFRFLDEVQCFLKPDGIVISLTAINGTTGIDHFEAQANFDDLQRFYLPSTRYWAK